MIVGDELRKCVAFVGMQMADKTMRLVGSGFFLGRGQSASMTSVRFVTARHVIDGIKRKGINEVYLRMNRVAGDAEWLKSSIDHWFVHPTDNSIDVAMVECGIPAQFDHLIIPFSLGATETALRDNEVGLGDEVFITGLFSHHHGTRRNIPIVRIGNIATFDEEKIETENFGLIVGYLIEARSIGGLSGSPVFVNMGLVRRIQGEVKHSTGTTSILLLGLIHGHYDIKAADVDEIDEGAIISDRVNTGIAIVVPFHHVAEVFALSEQATIKTQS